MRQKAYNFTYGLGACLLIVGLSGCGTLQRASDIRAGNSIDGSIEEREVSSTEVEANIREPYESPLGNVPLDYNPRVQRWLDYFQGRGRKHMVLYLERSARYEPMMKNVLRENGLPEELFYVALIESGFSPRAHSHANAVGYWQFISGTGKRYGLKIDGYIDERRDPVLSTRAAADYFKSLYSMFGSWHLALASYNTGENRVQRAVMRSQTRDFWTLIQRFRLPRETQNYVPKYIAAAMIASDPQKYGFTDLNYQEPLSYETITVRQPVNLAQMAKELNITTDDMKMLNPKFRSDYAPIYKGSELTLRVPTRMREQGLLAAANSVMLTPPPPQNDHFYYRVRRGDTLSGIASRHRTTVATLRRLNNMSPRSVLRAGSRLRVPDRGGSVSQQATRSSASSARAVAAVSAPGGVHVVRRGENLTLIARRYGTSVGELRRLNNLGNRSVLHVGQRLVVSEQGSGVTRPQVHVVRRGENLTLIARRYGTSVGELRRLNNMQNRSVLHVGQRLTLRGERVHVVRRGETLSQIASRYNVPISRLVQENELSSRSHILAGSQLIIP